ncbi:hypothetical protein VOLCADRAFT_103210 [Volvox carteri f. nagariensis]|uniref:Uncharacterized protein n=1 Tax=Volvox carteri f. nagariensis TaxID=3068 RepID=D8TK67_VOLCA|nr:uncharacterized protein VOLCADRAFT_103210 [Volvox carteri f. nagariensis]EFJ52196.1 hypothetical protein VOLCADRAFT_103210 [Volvox carteri f. nagariensis]|eukprot:XP_002946970.1 hypothetical protein VOLCADRAFT_103210 [Volvox carteri f. nagariensis]
MAKEQANAGQVANGGAAKLDDGAKGTSGSSDADAAAKDATRAMLKQLIVAGAPFARPLTLAAAGAGRILQYNPTIPAIQPFWQGFDYVRLTLCSADTRQKYQKYDMIKLSAVHFSMHEEILKARQTALLLFDVDRSELLGVWKAVETVGDGSNTYITWRVVKRLAPMSKEAFHASAAGTVFPTLPPTDTSASARGEAARLALRVLSEHAVSALGSNGFVARVASEAGSPPAAQPAALVPGPPTTDASAKPPTALPEMTETSISLGGVQPAVTTPLSHPVTPIDSTTSTTLTPLPSAGSDAPAATASLSKSSGFPVIEMSQMSSASSASSASQVKEDITVVEAAPRPPAQGTLDAAPTAPPLSAPSDDATAAASAVLAGPPTAPAVEGADLPAGGEVQPAVSLARSSSNNDRIATEASSSEAPSIPSTSTSTGIGLPESGGTLAAPTDQPAPASPPRDTAGMATSVVHAAATTPAPLIPPWRRFKELQLPLRQRREAQAAAQPPSSGATSSGVVSTGPTPVVVPAGAPAPLVIATSVQMAGVSGAPRGLVTPWPAVNSRDVTPPAAALATAAAASPTAPVNVQIVHAVSPPQMPQPLQSSITAAAPVSAPVPANTAAPVPTPLAPVAAAASVAGPLPPPASVPLPPPVVQTHPGPATIRPSFLLAARSGSMPAVAAGGGAPPRPVASMMAPVRPVQSALASAAQPGVRPIMRQVIAPGPQPTQLASVPPLRPAVAAPAPPPGPSVTTGGLQIPTWEPPSVAAVAPPADAQLAALAEPPLPRQPATRLLCPLCHERTGCWFLLSCKHMGPCEVCCSEPEQVQAMYPTCVRCGEVVSAKTMMKARVS